MVECIWNIGPVDSVMFVWWNLTDHGNPRRTSYGAQRGRDCERLGRSEQSLMNI
jgi:hypothetical protein